jgi:hypothetical protein
MATVQTIDQMQAILTRLEGEEIAAFQVLGINSLKSMSPPPDALEGEIVESVRVSDRQLSVSTVGHTIDVDLQRTGKLVWLKEAGPYVFSVSGSRPTVRLVFAGGHGLDLTEPTKTKRITVTISTRS